jgi:GNAT superfamily N-acetyltransferase
MIMKDYFISTDPSLLDHDFIVRSLNSTYWASDRPREVIERSLSVSLCFGAYAKATNQQVGFARVVTDRSTFAWICDVFVAPDHRSLGLGKRLVAEIVGHPDLATASMCLGTKDAHGLYEPFGFVRLEMMRRGKETAANTESGANR